VLSAAHGREFGNRWRGNGHHSGRRRRFLHPLTGRHVRRHSDLDKAENLSWHPETTHKPRITIAWACLSLSSPSRRCNFIFGFITNLNQGMVPKLKQIL